VYLLVLWRTQQIYSRRVRSFEKQLLPSTADAKSGLVYSKDFFAIEMYFSSRANSELLTALELRVFSMCVKLIVRKRYLRVNCLGTQKKKNQQQ